MMEKLPNNNPDVPKTPEINLDSILSEAIDQVNSRLWELKPINEVLIKEATPQTNIQQAHKNKAEPASTKENFVPEQLSEIQYTQEALGHEATTIINRTEQNTSGDNVITGDLISTTSLFEANLEMPNKKENTRRKLQMYLDRLKLLKKLSKNAGGRLKNNNETQFLSRLRNHLMGHAEAGDPPSIIQIEPTSLCNLSCEYCIQHAGKKRGELHKPGVPSGNMDMTTFNQILDDNKDALYMQLQGQGEPLLNQNFEEMALEAKRRGFIVTTISNGMLLNAKNREMLLRCNLDSFIVSLDITDAETMEKNRKGLNVSMVVERVKKLIAERNASGSTTMIGISAVILPSDIPQFEKIIRQYDEDIKPDFIVASPLASASGSDEDYEKMYSDDMRKNIIQNNLTVPKLRGVSAYVNTCQNINFGPSGVCLQTRSTYYRYDGSTAYCQDRHKITDNNPRQSMQEVAKTLSRGECPLGCQGCHYLPSDLRTAHPKKINT